MKVFLDKSNNIIKWEQLVGYKIIKNKNDYIVVNYYNNNNHILSISEFIDGYPYTSEINTIDESKAIVMLNTFGFKIEFIENINLSKESYDKLEGFNNLGYGVLSFKKGIFYLNDLIPLDFLSDIDKKYILNIYSVEKDSDGTMLIYKILNRG